MKVKIYFLLLLILISCGRQGCNIIPNTTVQTKTETKTDSKTIDSTESKSIADQVRDLRDNLQPGAQLKCNF
jgi:hypothetical protein